MRARCSKFALFGALILTATPAAADDPAIDELRREMRMLRSEVQSLRRAISEAAELDRQRAAMLTRALENSGGQAAVGAPSLPSDEPKNPEPAAAPAPVVAERRESRGGGSGTITGKVDVPSGEPVAYVYVENIQERAVRGQKVTMDQIRKQFAPRWAVIQRGTTVEFPNLDSVHHNVFSRTPGNTFDLGLYSSVEPGKSWTFNNAGPVDVYCNIHPRMSASILVVPNRYFAKVKDDGSFEIANVPAGKRKVVAWAPGSSTQAQWIEVKSGSNTSAELKLQARSGDHLNRQGRPYGSYP